MASIPPPAGSHGAGARSDRLGALQYANFRRLAASNILGTSGIWIMRIAMDWLVLELTGSLAAVGITVAMQFGPLLLFGIWGGIIVDRYSRRMLLITTQAVGSALSVILAVLALTGTVEVWHVNLTAIAMGFIAIIDNPARQAFVLEVAGSDHLRHAISINSAVFQLGGLIGPAAGGLLIVTVGIGWAFAANAVTCAVTVVTLSTLRSSALFRTVPAGRFPGQLREGLRFARREPAIMWTLVLLAFVSTFCFNMPVILAAYADAVFDLGAAGYGIFNSLVAIGALAGAIVSTLRRTIRLRTVVFGALLWGSVQGATAFIDSQLVFAAALVLLGVVTLLFLTAAISLVQCSAAPQLLGRVMAIYTVILFGGQTLGSPMMGWILQHFGAAVGMAVSGFVPACVALVLCLVLARRGRLRLRLRLSRSYPVIAIIPRRSACS